MTKHRTGTRQEWLSARLALLEAEKDLTRRSDDLARRVRATVGQEGVNSRRRRIRLAGGRLWRALTFLVTISCSGPTTAGCPSCSAIADGFDGIAVHLANHDVMRAVSRAPLITAGVQAAHGVDVSLGVLVRQRLQLDFSVGFTEAQQREAGIECNYRREALGSRLPEDRSKLSCATARRGGRA